MITKKSARLVCLLLLLILSAQLSGAASDTYPYEAFALDSVRLRKGPSFSALVLDVVQKGESVIVKGAEGSYKIVDFKGKNGYIVASFLSENGLGLATPPPADPGLAARYQELSSGDEGASVKALQQGLAELGFYKSKVDSKYGGDTMQAVLAFQGKNNLTVSGVAGAQTQALLFEGNPYNASGRKTDIATLPLVPGLTMRPGDAGDLVAELQRNLATLGYYNGSIDGKYGKNTEKAVVAFQKANNLRADGLAGEKTQTTLFRLISQGGGTPAPQATPEQFRPEATQPLTADYPYTTTSNSSVNLRKRASLSSMRLLTVPQGAEVSVLEDVGTYLKITYKSYIGYVAKSYINIPEQYLEGKALKTDTAARVAYETLATGANGKKVRALQQALSELGFYAKSIDGIFGGGTITALKAFQKRNGLRETGIAVPELQQLLYEKRVRNSKNKLVYVKTLPPVDGITMAPGDYGDAVYELQQMLLRLSLYDSTVGYEYNRATESAVRAFQKAHSIKVTGKADSFTQLAIKTSLALIAPTGNPQPDSTPPLTTDTVVIIRSGTRGIPVSKLQARLVELGYYSITPDGIYNSDDIAAVRAFQRVNNLTVNGIGDLATQQTLYADYALKADAQTNDPQNPGVLRIGSSGDAVRMLQTRLIDLKYLTGRADGIFGTQTALAVTAFQKINNLATDGIAGSRTLSVLYGANAKSNTPSAPLDQPFVPLTVGSKGSEVSSVQQRLITLKYLTGNADGIFGPRTFLAVKAFQERNRLDADGIVGKLTLAAINSSKAIAAAGVIPPVVPGPTVPDGGGDTFTPPKASEVRFANWYKEIRSQAQSMRNVIVYDFISGTHYNFRFFSLGKHADGTTLTKGDTAVMNAALGVNNWTPRPVWVIFSNGRVYMASTHSHGHEVDYISGNNLTGHLCVHFPRDMAEAAQTGPYAVSHQNAILAGWDLTQNMAR